MINRITLLSDLQKLLQLIEADLLERSESADVPEVGKTLRAEYDRAKTAERTAQNFEDWRTDAITQAAAAWVLSCVFVRFLEDNRLIDPPKIAGPEDRLERARDEHELYFRNHPKQTDREYLLAVFEQLAKLPGTKDVFGEHNPIRELLNWLSGDAAVELLRFFQKIDANRGTLVHDFTDPNWDTRFLGDLYQDLSEAARKKYALLQTPEFVEEFILDRTLNPALDEFGLDAAPVLDKDGKPVTEAGFRLIDPACGSGHFLLGSFPRILDRWQRKEPGANVRELAQRTLDGIFGVDVNPYAVAIARFRLLLAVMRACGIERLDKNVPGFTMNLACGDSLLHVPLRTGQRVFDFELTSDDTECEHAYQSEDLPVLKRMLRGGQYHAVVANPPYITVKDRQLNERYRRRYRTCHMKYSLAVPFLERIFRLAVAGGYTGQITANSFMKREFGKKLIESFFPSVDLTHVIDTSGAYVPGHGTPTVILFGRHRPPMASTLRTVMGIRGEPTTPDDPARGLVWSAILEQLDQPGSQSPFVSVGDSSRELFHKHPWSVGGGGAAELKERLEDLGGLTLGTIADSGVAVVTLDDEAFQLDSATARRTAIPSVFFRGFVIGDMLRDWQVCDIDPAIFPHDAATFEAVPNASILRRLWPLRIGLINRLWFRKTMPERGMKWFAYGHISTEKFRTPLSIAFAFVASHNHFILDRGGKVFNRSAPVIKLPTDATEDDHLLLLGLLNSSTAGFWMKQVMQPKQMTAGDGVRIESIAKVPHEFSSTQMNNLPLPPDWETNPQRPRITALSREADELATRLAIRTSGNAIVDALREGRRPGDVIAEYKRECAAIHSRLILLQEEIDFVIYAAYGLAGVELFGDEVLGKCTEIGAADRPFCIIHQHNQDGFAVPTTIPKEWPAELQSLWQRRIAAIRASSELRVIEDPHYKRRWIGRQGKYNHIQNANEVKDACETWLLNRLESYFDFDGRMNDAGESTAKLDIALVSVAKLADAARHDAEFQQVGELHRDDSAFDVQTLVTELVAAECVPLLPVHRYKPSGLIKRGTWERTWDLQRHEDAIDARTKLPSTDQLHLSDAAAHDLKQKQVGNIPVPTKYDAKDFLDSNLWRLRGKLDVPKERWISFPHCEGPDGTTVICWAGYDHLQQARAISAYYVRVQTEFGGSDDARLIPLLACLIELLPWLKQWHNEPDANFDGMRMGDYFEGFVNEEARQLNKTIPEIKAWTPPKTVAKGQRGKGAKKGKKEKGEE